MRRRELITAVAALIGITANMIIMWYATTWDILEILFGGILGYILEVWIGILVKDFLQVYTEWRFAELNRAEKAAAKRRRRENYKDYDLRNKEDDEWYEVSLEQVI